MNQKEKTVEYLRLALSLIDTKIDEYAHKKSEILNLIADLESEDLLEAQPLTDVWEMKGRYDSIVVTKNNKPVKYFEFKSHSGIVLAEIEAHKYIEEQKKAAHE